MTPRELHDGREDGLTALENLDLGKVNSFSALVGALIAHSLTESIGDLHYITHVLNIHDAPGCAWCLSSLCRAAGEHVDRPAQGCWQRRPRWAAGSRRFTRWRLWSGLN